MQNVDGDYDEIVEWLDTYPGIGVEFHQSHGIWDADNQRLLNVGLFSLDYREPLEQDQYEEDCEDCGGKQFVTGGYHYYNGSYDCYTMYLLCVNCGPYEVECV
jgi:hypothetical protein